MSGYRVVGDRPLGAIVWPLLGLHSGLLDVTVLSDTIWWNVEVFLPMWTNNCICPKCGRRARWCNGVLACCSAACLFVIGGVYGIPKEDVEAEESEGLSQGCIEDA